MHPAILSSTACLAFAAGIFAQTTVVTPAQFARLPGPSANTHPIGPTITTSPSMRYQSIHDDMAGKPGSIKGMALRLNEGATSVATSITI